MKIANLKHKRMKKNYLVLVLLTFFSLVVMQSCDDDVDSNYGVSQVSWMPLITSDGEEIKPAYLEEQTLEFVIKFKMFEGNEVESIALSEAIVDEATGEPGAETLVKEFTLADFEEVPEQKQYKIDVNFELPKAKYTDQKLHLSLVFKTVQGITQERTMEFSVNEYFPHIINGVKYYYMYDNTHTDSGKGYTVEHSAGFTSAITVMNHYGFDSENANFIADLGGKLEKHTVDWMASYYVPVYSNLAQDVPGLHSAYRLEAPYYGGPKSVKSTEVGTYEEIDAAIANGQMVIIHGDFRGDVAFKHQMVLVATNDRSFLALDPAGKWNGVVNGEYNSLPTAGVYAKYSKEDVYAAIGENGKVWMHIPVDPADEEITLDE